MNKYLQYDSVDFAQEQSFVSWVRKSNSDDEFFWQEWIAKHPEKKEEISKAISLVNQIQFKKDKISEGVEERVWAGIQKNISKGTSINNQALSKKSDKSNSKGKLIRLFSLAAVAAIAIFLLMVNTRTDFDSIIQTQLADMQSVTLPDGSTVQLNSDSKLSYNSENWESERILNLEGEAFFEVKKGSKFTVHTNNGEVTVLGTSFNIYNRAKAFDVYCKTGKVSVSDDKNTTILTPNQSVSVKNKLHNMQKDVEPNDIRSQWREGVYRYKSTSIYEVTEELERQFGVKVSLSEEIKKKQYTGSFHTQSLESALAEVYWPLDLKYTINEKNIVVSK